jgi:hypothetical protein
MLEIQGMDKEYAGGANIGDGGWRKKERSRKRVQCFLREYIHTYLPYGKGPCATEIGRENWEHTP